MRTEVLAAEADAAERHQEDADQLGIRPSRLADFVGQTELKRHLGIICGAARKRAQTTEHLLFAGPPGLGKTTLAGIVATEMGVVQQTTSGPALERAGDLAAILTKLGEGDILFIDEIHRLNRAVEEVLYPAMEDFRVDIVLGKGPAARSIPLALPRFTLIGATTRVSMITGPLRDRFGFTARLDFYPPSELQQIVVRSAGILGVDITSGAAAEISRRARGTPRIANRLLRLVRDFAQVEGDGRINEETAKAALKVFGVDERGLDRQDRAVLEALCQSFAGGPVGLSTLAISVSEPPETLEEVYEPFLITQGLIMRTPRGRVAMPAAWEHLGLEPPSEQPPAGGFSDAAEDPRTQPERPPGLFD